MNDEEVLKRAEEIKQRKIEEYRQQSDAVEKRIQNGGEPFREDEVRYAAWLRCGCGAGLAYPLHIGMHGSWYCSDWLTARNSARTSGKHDEYPFVFYEIKSEHQPSAQGATTRPKGEPV